MRIRVHSVLYTTVLGFTAACGTSSSGSGASTDASATLSPDGAPSTDGASLTEGGSGTTVDGSLTGTDAGGPIVDGSSTPIDGSSPVPEGGEAGAEGGTTAPDAAVTASYYVGADITSVQAAEAAGATYSDGTVKDIFQLLKDHGFNYIRLRTFVNPKAADGYDQVNGYADLAHTITFGKRIKAAGMGFLLDFHYSDNWADPGKQCVPVAWQGYTTITDLATALHDYTDDAITQLIAGDARPDMVQIGNEITPGMLFDICDSGGLPTATKPLVSGSTSNWTNLGTLLKAGVKGVKDVDTGIKIMLHIDQGGDKPTEAAGTALNTSTTWINNAVKQGVVFDVFGESSYQAYQGDPNSVTNTQTTWTNTFGGLATKFPNIQFVAAEYGPMERQINDVVFGLPNNQGAGTFNWEPSEQGAWNTGHALFSNAGNKYTTTADMALYDLMKTAYASRL
jgi:arabinogalactan endo-1,4-beta-galactosidase